MAAVTTLGLFLGFHDDRWRHVGPDRFWIGTAIAAIGSALLAFNRFGGLTVQAPRSFVRFALVGVWGWVLLSLAIWLIGRLVLRRSGRSTDPSPPPPPVAVLTAIGYAHQPLIYLGALVIVLSSLVRLSGPGFVVAAFTFALWLPALLTVAVGHAFQRGRATSAMIVAGPYLVWVAIVGRHLLDQLSHVL